MALTDAGLTEMVKATIGEAITSFASANCHVGSGDTATAFAGSQTDLAAPTNKLRKTATNSRSGLVYTITSTFATTDANWAWQEWGIFNASSGPTMLSRKVESLGTKTSAQSWTVTATLTFSVGA